MLPLSCKDVWTTYYDESDAVKPETRVEPESGRIGDGPLDDGCDIPLCLFLAKWQEIKMSEAMSHGRGRYCSFGKIV
jgi:hypothetical protein